MEKLLSFTQEPAFKVVLVVLLLLGGGLSLMKKIEFLFTGPNSIAYNVTYLLLALVFFFLWYFVWVVLHAV